MPSSWCSFVICYCCFDVLSTELWRTSQPILIRNHCGQDLRTVLWKAFYSGDNEGNCNIGHKTTKVSQISSPSWLWMASPSRLRRCQTLIFESCDLGPYSIVVSIYNEELCDIVRNLVYDIVGEAAI